MNRFFGRLFSAILLALITLPFSAASGTQAGQRIFSGEITDGICGMNGSHAQMMKSMSSMGTDKESCTRQCIRLGVAYVMYDPVSQTLYHLDAPSKAEPFAGQKVRIAGTLDAHTIKITNIEAAN
jgi:hypothetical protein